MKRLLPIILAAYSGLASAGIASSQINIYGSLVVKHDSDLALCTALEERLNIETDHAYKALFGFYFDQVAIGGEIRQTDYLPIYAATDASIREAKGYLKGFAYGATFPEEINIYKEQWTMKCSEYGELP